MVKKHLKHLRHLKHLKKVKPNIYLIIVILLVILASLKSDHKNLQQLQPKNTVNPQATRILTKNLLQAKEQYDKAEGVAREQKKQDLIKVAVERKEKLLQEAETNPQAFLTDANLVYKRDQFPEEVKPHIEQELKATGSLITLHSDNFDEKKSKFEYFLDENKDNKANIVNPKDLYQLYFAQNPPQLETDSKVSAFGVGLERKLVLAAGGGGSGGGGGGVVTKYILQPISVANAFAAGEQKTAVFLLEFPKSVSSPVISNQVTAEQIRSTVFSEQERSVNRFFRGASFGKTYLSGDVLGPYVVSKGNVDCANYDWSSQAEVLAQQKGIDLNKYQRYVFVLPNDSNCWFSGQGTIGGNPSRSWMAWYQNFPNTYAHELGHNLGLHHANFLYCWKSGQPIDLYENCDNIEYGDPYDVMGRSYNMNYFNVPHRISLGWISESEVLTITQSGSHVIYPSESLGTSLKSIRIPRANTDDYYYLSLRGNYGFDSSLPKSLTKDGLSIHIWDGSPLSQTKFLDATPGGLGWLTDPALPVGSTFSDPDNKITVTNKGLYGGGLLIDVKLEQSYPVTSYIKDWKGGQQLPLHLYSQKSVALNGYLYLLGGYDAKSSATNHFIYNAKILEDGSIDSWTENNPLPQDMQDVSAVAATNNHIYVIDYYSNLWSGDVDDAGKIRSWSKQNLPYGGYEQLVVGKGYIFTEVSDYTSKSGGEVSVYKAKINDDGSVREWIKTLSLPDNRYSSQISLVKDSILLIGGYSGDNYQPVNSIYSAKINDDGSLNSWNQAGVLPKDRSDFRVFSFGSYIGLMGGYAKDYRSRSDIFLSKLSSDNKLEAWSLDNFMPENISYPAVITYNDLIFIVGGYGLANLQSAVYSAKFEPPPSENVPPQGAIDKIYLGALKGWAADPNEPYKPITVKMVVDSPEATSSGTLDNAASSNFQANKAGFTGNHGFSFPLSKYADGKEHQIYIFAQDSSDKKFYQLKNSPIVYSSSGNKLPTGSLEKLNDDGTLQGWVFDPDEASKSAKVKFIVDGKEDQYFEAEANILRDDINNNNKISGNHGFSLSTPSKYLDGKPHDIEAYGIDIETGERARLSNSPRNTLNTTNRSPEGNVEDLDKNGVVHGWFYDPDEASSSGIVKYAVDYSDPSYAYDNIQTDILRSDVNEARKISGNHGFQFTIPSYYFDGKDHKLYIYAQDLQTGVLQNLPNSPKLFNIQSASPSATPTATSSGTLGISNQPNLIDKLINLIKNLL